MPSLHASSDVLTRHLASNTRREAGEVGSCKLCYTILRLRFGCVITSVWLLSEKVQGDLVGEKGVNQTPQSFPGLVFSSQKLLTRIDFRSLQSRRRTNVQQLTCKINSSSSFYYLFFSFIILELKPFVLKGKVLGENSEKCQKVRKSVKNYETILPFSCCPLVLPLQRHVHTQ